jgi:hypothetical protein
MMEAPESPLWLLKSSLSIIKGHCYLEMNVHQNSKDEILRIQMPTNISETPAGAAPPKQKSRVLRNVVSNWGAYLYQWR